MRHHTRTASPTVDSGKCHSAWGSAWSRLQTQIHTVLSDGTSIVSGRFPGKPQSSATQTQAHAYTIIPFIEKQLNQ